MIPIVRHRGSDPSNPPSPLFRPGDEVYSIDRPGVVGEVIGIAHGLVFTWEHRDGMDVPTPVQPGPRFVNPGYMGGHWRPVSYRVRFGDVVSLLSEDFLFSARPTPPVLSPLGTFDGQPVKAVGPPLDCFQCGGTLHQLLVPGEIAWAERGPEAGQWQRHRSCLRRI